ncbi:metallophosphoesterase [Acetobacteraceae bacterium KSS8]|uniref:Metallophosphoesterase n=1 Tax=Endosaccharibacter trunci TaxID=2812733 RepID=A0ABT1W6W9_9PROT|nr:metallophosphoesterase [Acetobacteraceae bacterium KSS8]
MTRTRFRLAHLSDPHLPFDPVGDGLGEKRLTIKQRMALQSWRRKRRHISTLSPDRALRDDLAAFGSDHVAVTGDLVNLGTTIEYRRARSWLERIGPADAVSVAPGNHDATARGTLADGFAQWQPFMSGDAPAPTGAVFPFLRVRGPVAIVALCSAIPTRPGSAAGRLGHRQIARAAALLEEASRRGLFRIVLIHHPPFLGPGGPRKALRDRGPLRRMLGRTGAELVLHGHHHRASLAHLQGPAGPIPVFGVPAALASSPRPELGGWLAHTVRPDGAGWMLDTTLRRYDPAHGRFEAERCWRHLLFRS